MLLFCFLLPFLFAEYSEAWVVPNVGRFTFRTGVSTEYVERPGWSNEANSCHMIRGVPDNLRQAEHMYPNGLDNFYQKYTEAYGIPVIGSAKISDTALMRACYVIRFLLADRPDVRESFYKMFGRYALMAHDEVTLDIPEHSDMTPYWNTRARGLGGIRTTPVSTGGEENAVCLKQDGYSEQDILLHELVHGIHLIGAQFAIPGFDDKIRAAYAEAKGKGLWANTYAMTNEVEYFACAAQSYFNDNAISNPPDGIHNNIYNRERLKTYDPRVYGLLEELWPCKNTFLSRCLTTRADEQAQTLRMNCDGASSNFFSYSQRCVDSEFVCPDDAMNGQCSTMSRKCPRSCRQCTTTYRMGTANSGTPSTTRPNTDCVDRSSFCSVDICKRDIDYTVANCRKTCTNCDYYIGLMASQCEDLEKKCSYWASTGQCTKNPDIMLATCMKSCHVC